MDKGIKEGAYAIQEQGDLGLGATEINPKYIKGNGKMEGVIEIPKDSDIGFDFGKKEN